MKFRFALAFAVILAGSSCDTAEARDIPRAPSSYVYDEADWLSPARERNLSGILHEYERESSNQIVVAVFESLEDEDLADFSQRVAQAWKIGQEDRDNGILLAIYANDRLLSIEVGYGLEPVVTDLVAETIRREVITPKLRNGRYEEGVIAGTQALIQASRGEFEGSGQTGYDRRQRRVRLVYFVVAIAIFIALAVANRNAKFDYGSPTFGNRGRRRTFGRMRSPGRIRVGGFGGGKGGGFGGGGGFIGGGGGFGGGGARGGW